MIEERIFNNRYRLDRKLGEGGMATVFCGTDTLLRRRVAIKVLRDQYAADEEFVRRFYQEAESAAKLSHPNIVNTFDVGREGDTYFIVMELVDGPSLAEIIAADGRLPEPVAIDYAAQIASGLAYAHRQGLLHRDIKPANILVTKDDVVKLSDFGIARAVSQQTMALTKPGLVMGSVYYISPEQAQEHEVHETADLYSLGVVLYQMLTGKLPYAGESPVTVALKHIGDPVPTIDHARDRRKPGAWRPSSIACCRRSRSTAFNRQAISRPRCARRASAPASPGIGIADDAPVGATQVLRRTQALPPRRSPMPDRAVCRRGVRRTPAAPRAQRGRLGPFAACGDGARLRTLRSRAARTAPRLDGRRLHRHVASAGAAGGRQRRSAHALHQERERNDPARSRDSAIAAGRHAGREESVVELVVSNGKPLLGLEDVRGFSVNDAQRALQQQGFAVTLNRRFDNTVKDNVIEQNPKAGAKVPEGEPRHADRFRRPARPSIVPNFVGMTLDKAQAAARERRHHARHLAARSGRSGRYDRVAEHRRKHQSRS